MKAFFLTINITLIALMFGTVVAVVNVTESASATVATVTAQEELKRVVTGHRINAQGQFQLTYK